MIDDELAADAHARVTRGTWKRPEPHRRQCSSGLAQGGPASPYFRAYALVTVWTVRLPPASHASVLRVTKPLVFARRVDPKFGPVEGARVSKIRV